MSEIGLNPVQLCCSGWKMKNSPCSPVQLCSILFQMQIASHHIIFCILFSSDVHMFIYKQITTYVNNYNDIMNNNVRKRNQIFLRKKAEEDSKLV